MSTPSTRSTARDAEIPPADPRARMPRERVVGAIAIALAASLVIQNAVVISAGSPSYADPMARVLAFHAEHRVAVAICVGLEALNLPLLLGFVTGLQGLLAHRAGGGKTWARLAIASAATLSAMFALYAVLWIGVVLAADGLSEPTPSFALVWQLHAAAFALALPALGTTFIGAALAARGGGLSRRCFGVLGVVGGVLLIAAGTASLAIADGSALVFVGMPGFAAWIVWLLATGIRLVRGRALPAA